MVVPADVASIETSPVSRWEMRPGIIMKVSARSSAPGTLWRSQMSFSRVLNGNTWYPVTR